MLTTFIVALREFLEVFLIIGVFLGISKKLNLHREREIVTASIIGILIALILPFTVFLFSEQAQAVLTKENTELLEGYLMIFSVFFLAYVIFSLHKTFVLKRSKLVMDIHQKMQKNIFDFSLFITIIFFIIREGFEVALFTATTSLFSRFMENITGLTLGFLISSVLGLTTFFAYVKFPISKVFKWTEYFIILLGASFVKNGMNELLEIYFNIHLDRIFPIALKFLPHPDSTSGHFLKNIIGIEQNFSLAKIAIMVIYIVVVYFLFLRRVKHQPLTA